MLATYGADYSIFHYVKTLIGFRETGRKLFFKQYKNSAMNVYLDDFTSYGLLSRTPSH